MEHGNDQARLKFVRSAPCLRSPLVVGSANHHPLKF